MLMYWKKERYLLDYMWMDYFLDIIYNDYPDIRKDIDAVGYNNPYTNKIFYYSKEEYNEVELMKVLESTNFFKLSYKYKYPKLKNGKETVYGYFYRNTPWLH